MIDRNRRNDLIKSVRPSDLWKGEPPLGGWYGEKEIQAAVRAIRDSMDWNKGFTGPEIEEFERAFAEYVDTEYAVAINGAGAGLDMSMWCLDLKPDDEIICPAINFHGDHVAIIGQGGKLIFCEADPGTLNADPEDVERRITPRTRAILVTHMNGLSADMDALLEVAERHSSPSRPIRVIGDAARSSAGEYRGTKIGKKGWMTIFSFHTMKLMTTLGEGGMITTDDADVVARIRRYRSFGEGVAWGTNFKMNKVQAAVGLVQLRRLDEIIDARRRMAEQRTRFLKGVPELSLPHEPPGYKHTYYLYNILVQPGWRGRKRDRLMKILAEEYNVGSVVANPPTYTYNEYIRKHTEGQSLPISEEIGARLFNPSMHPLMTGEQNEYVSAAIIEAVERIREKE